MSVIKKLSVLVFLVFAILIAGCATTVFSNKGAMSAEQAAAQAPTKKGKNHFWVSGLGQTRHIPAIKICGSEDKIARVDTRLSFVDWLLGAVTFGIYTPSTYRVFCQT